MTPNKPANRRADALHTLPDGTRYFVEPHTEHMTMHELFEAISTSEQVRTLLVSVPAQAIYV